MIKNVPLIYSFVRTRTESTELPNSSMNKVKSKFRYFLFTIKINKIILFYSNMNYYFDILWQDNHKSRLWLPTRRHKLTSPLRFRWSNWGKNFNGSPIHSESASASHVQSAHFNWSTVDPLEAGMEIRAGWQEKNGPVLRSVRDLILRDRFPSKGSCSHATNLIVIDAC